MKRVRVGDTYVIADSDELNSGSDHEITIDDLDMSRDEYLEAKRAAFRRQGYEETVAFKESVLYNRIKLTARNKGLDLPLEREEFLDKLYTIPVSEKDGRVRPFATIALEARGVTRISPQKEGIDLYYLDNLVDSIIY